jgi:Fe-S-cluster containining protein
MACTPESGTCRTCIALCEHKPGWFLPGEAEKAAELMGLPITEFFGRWLSVDWWEGHPDTGRDVFVLSPAVVDGRAGEEFARDPSGRCVFLTPDKRCRIHAAKPHECRQAWCGQDDRSGEARHRHQEVATAWIGHQDQIAELLGDEPMASAYEGGLLGWLQGGW